MVLLQYHSIAVKNLVRSLTKIKGCILVILSVCVIWYIVFLIILTPCHKLEIII